MTRWLLFDDIFTFSFIRVSSLLILKFLFSHVVNVSPPRHTVQSPACFFFVSCLFRLFSLPVTPCSVAPASSGGSGAAAGKRLLPEEGHRNGSVVDSVQSGARGGGDGVGGGGGGGGGVWDEGRSEYVADFYWSGRWMLLPMRRGLEAMRTRANKNSWKLTNQNINKSGNKNVKKGKRKTF
jgi:hypothetical protein